MKQPDQRQGAVEQSLVKSATRALDLLEYLGRWGSEKTHTEIAADLGIPKSSLTQLLKTLVGRQYLSYTPASKGYEVGPAISRLARNARGGGDVVAIAQSVLEWVTSQTGESCALNVIKGDVSQVVAGVASPHRLLYHMRVGDSAPLYATSGGKALLAFLPDEMREEYLSRVTFERITPATIRTTAALRRELAKVRSTGIAFVTEEFTRGIAGVARPILDSTGHVLAAVNVAVPMVRFDEAARDHCVEILGIAATTIAQRLAGFAGDLPARGKAQRRQSSLMKRDHQ